MDTVGDRVRQVRKQNSLTLVKFGNRIGITATSVSTIENGKTNPSDQTIRSICREFGVDEIWLRTGAGEPFQPKSRDEELAEYVGGVLGDGNRDMERLALRVMMTLDADTWEKIADEVRKICEEKKP